ncbi:MAG: response regulator transcription factor [Niastella sp.]|nr:response regulator transcription factor [Niastella sp.]
MRVLIIEDESKAARELQQILQAIDADLEVVATIESVERALQWFAVHPLPDLIFSDIQLADGLCFDLFRQRRIATPVIFCTAFDEFLLHAFDTNAISYLLKPITREKVARALDKFSEMKAAFAKGPAQQNLQQLLQQLPPSYKTALLVHQQEKIIPLAVKEIAFFYLDNNLITATTLNNQKYFLTTTLEELEKLLDPSLFYRANRQFLIGRHAVLNAERFFARKLVVKLQVASPEVIVVSKARASAFLQWLEGTSV